MFVSYYLSKAGYAVTLCEKSTPFAFTSKYNAGYITPSFTSNFPVSFWYLASTMLGPRGPVYISPRQVLRNLRWFRIAMKRGLGGFEENVRQLSLKSLSMYKDFFREEASIDADVVEGLVGLYANPEFARESVRKFNGRFVDEQELREMGFAGFGAGCTVDDELSVNPSKLFRGLRNTLLNELEIIFRTGTDIKLVTDGRRVPSISIDGERIEADVHVVTAGANSKELLQPLGFDPQILPEIGRVLIFDTSGERIITRPALMEDDGCAVVQHNQTTFRATSFFELNGFSKTFPEDRKKWFLRTVSAHLLNYGKLKLVEEGVGFRPCSPDQLPVVGAVPGYDNLYIGSGNCRVGVTLAPASAYIIQSLIGGETPDDLPWRSFSPGRFSEQRGADGGHALS